MPHRILILGGTADAREIAHALDKAGHDVTTSLAGVTQQPAIPAGKLRQGGFGGAEGLRHYLIAHHIDVLVDATHPFAETISRNAAEAVAGMDVQHFRFEREHWTASAQDRWTAVSSIKEAVAVIAPGARVMAAIGRKDAHLFFSRDDISGVLRSIELPDAAIPTRWVHVRSKPAEDAAEEAALFEVHGITHLVCKNSGGRAGYAKIEASRKIGLRVIMIDTPHKQGGRTFHSVGKLLSWL